MSDFSRFTSFRLKVGICEVPTTIPQAVWWWVLHLLVPEKQLELLDTHRPPPPDGAGDPSLLSLRGGGFGEGRVGRVFRRCTSGSFDEVFNEDRLKIVTSERTDVG